ncbi:cytochrome b [Afifella pfennigii]|uniref:cytochrome b n=1 Tax=Afifella pfennigii TaxID=209897 RepID=UPI00069104D9|nr:cytochrome b/b6 domain-containing protein [Afifella pfennigii]
MMIRSTPRAYGEVRVFLHWSIAATVLVALVSGFAADNIGMAGRDALRLHVLAGLLAAVLTLARIAWWVAEPKQVPGAGGAERKGVLARAVHLLLVLVPLGMTVSGLSLILRSGAAPQLLTDAPGMLPPFEMLRPRRPHGFGARLILALVTVHAGAALYHHFVRRDGLMQKMWFTGRP